VVAAAIATIWLVVRPGARQPAGSLRTGCSYPLRSLSSWRLKPLLDHHLVILRRGASPVPTGSCARPCSHASTPGSEGSRRAVSWAAFVAAGHLSTAQFRLVRGTAPGGPDWVHRGRELASRPDRPGLTSSRTEHPRSSRTTRTGGLVSGLRRQARSTRLGVGELTPVKVLGGARPLPRGRGRGDRQSLLGRQGDPKGVRTRGSATGSSPRTSSSTGEAERPELRNAAGALRFHAVISVVLPVHNESRNTL